MQPKQPKKKGIQQDHNNTIFVAISNNEFQSHKNRGIQIVKNKEINLTVYTNPKVGWQYKNHLLKEAHFTGHKLESPKKEPSPPPIVASGPLHKPSSAIPEPFKMTLPDKLTEKAPDTRMTPKTAQYQLLIEGKSSYLYNNQPGRWTETLKQRIEGQLNRLKDQLHDATDVKHPQEKRAQSWKNSKQQIDNLKSSLSINPKKRDPKQLKQQITINVTIKNHFFKGEGSLQNGLKEYWKKNGDKFGPSDAKGQSSVSLNLDKFKESLDLLIKQIEKLIQSIRALMAPKA